MRRILIALNRYYNNYKTIIWIIIIAIVLFLLVTNAMNKTLRERSNSSSVNNTTTIVAVNESNGIYNDSSNSLSYINNVSNTITKKTDNEIISEVSSNEDAIKVFVNFCNSSKLDAAYSMLSDECKEILYPTKSDFVSNYYNIYFSEFRNVSINKYNGNSTYKVDYKLDSISTGGVSIDNKTDYITVNNDYKLNISSFIKKKQINKSTKNSYLKVNIINEYVFLNSESYEIEVENFTSANMYLDDMNIVSNTYLVDKNNNHFYLDIDNYEESELKISSNKTRNIYLQFSRTYKEDNDVLEMIFNNVKIENYEYTDSNYISSNIVTNNSQEIIYERKVTKYPDTVYLKVSFE